VAPVHTAVDAGFRVVAPDISGHGLSPGRRIGFDRFAEDLAALRDSLGPDQVHGYVGHSAGGLGMMAARYLHGLEARKFVCIATPSYPYPPVKVVGKKIHMPAEVVARFRETLSRQFRSDWDDITARAFCPSRGSELLLIHDPRDRYLDDDDVPRILAHWPGAQLHLAVGVGHENLIRDDECVTALLEFLRD
jgi:pimeloyl-ACP methyl ester carboxylesterase